MTVTSPRFWNITSLNLHDNNDIQTWKSYSDVGEIIRISRNIIENNDTKDIGKLVRMMKVHESQQSATVLSTIALLVGSKLDNNIEKETREAIGDIILCSNKRKERLAPKKEILAENNI